MDKRHTFAALKKRHRAEREHYAQGFSVRIHRALSWLNRAEQTDDDDGRFIFLWIAFNAAYARLFTASDRPEERRVKQAFFHQLVELDVDKRLYELLWHEFPQAIRGLLTNQFVYQPFWEQQAGGNSDWEDMFRRANRAANKALAAGDTAMVLGIVFSRLYTLRNQLMHGGATWNGAMNREQIRDGVGILRKIVPVIMEIMMNHPHAAWGDLHYPVIET